MDNTPNQAPAPQAPAETAAPAQSRSVQVEALVRQEAARVRKEQQFKTERAQFEIERRAFLAEKAKVDAFNDNWKQNPLKAVMDRGLTPEELWLMQQKGGNMTPEVHVKLLQDEIQALKQRFADGDTKSQKAAEEAAQSEFKGAEQEVLGHAKSYLEEQKDKYPLTHADGRADLVVKILDRHYEKTLKETGVGEELPIETAFKHVEAQLLKRAQKLSEVLQKTAQAQAPQVQPKPGRFRFDEEPRFSEANLAVEKPVKTLAQVVQQQVAPTISRYKTEEERESNALALLRAAKQRRGIA